MFDPDEMSYTELQAIVRENSGYSTEYREKASFELTVRRIQQSSVSDGIIGIKTLMKHARNGTNLDSHAKVIAEAILREDRKGVAEMRISLIKPLIAARSELEDLIYAGNEQQSSTYSESEFYSLIDDALDKNPMLCVEVGYNRVAGWVVSIYDSSGVGIAKAPLVVSVQETTRIMAMYLAAKEIKQRGLGVEL